MTTGNVFTLIMNDGIQDGILSHTQRLRERIADLLPQLGGKDAVLSDPKKANSVLLELNKSHRIFVNFTYKPFLTTAFEYFKCTDKRGAPKLGSTYNFILPNMGYWLYDAVLHVRLSGLHAKNQKDRVKYVEMLGHRLIEKISFSSSQTVFAEYGTEVMNKYFEFNVPYNKIDGWLRNIGQELPKVGYLVADPRGPEVREYRYFADGPQTLKRQHEDVDLWIPLIFWFNTDISQAFPIAKLNTGVLEISVKFRDARDICSSVDYGGGGEINYPKIDVCDLYTNQITTIPDVANILLADYNFGIIRNQRSHEMLLNQESAAIKLNELKYPVESIFIAFRPEENFQDADNWHRNVKLKEHRIKTPVVVDKPELNMIAINYAIYHSEEPVIDECSLELNGIELFPRNPPTLYSSYLSYIIPGLNTPQDQGWLLFNFAYRPDSLAPSGHLNMSINRDLYLKYRSKYINYNNHAKLIYIAQTLQFIIIEDNTVMLKYL
jgi:hypothetical protein